MALKNLCWFMVNLASWKGGDFFFFPLYSMMSLLEEVLSLFSLLILQPRNGFIQILSAQSSAQKIRNGSEFQQRGQKNSANSLQMCLWAVWGNTVLPSLERKRTLHGESSVNYERKTSVTQYSWFCLTVWFSREEKRGNTETQACSFHSLEELRVC